MIIGIEIIQIKDGNIGHHHHRHDDDDDDWDWDSSRHDRDDDDKDFDRGDITAAVLIGGVIGAVIAKNT